MTQPVDLGSGGGSGAYGGTSAGGGFIRLAISGTLTLSGQILAQGGNGSGSNAGGGSGGGINITAGTVLGSGGAMAADGGNKSSSSGGPGGGGGGRIALYYVTDGYTGTLTSLNKTVNGGTGYQSGGVGTIFINPAPTVASLGPTAFVDGSFTIETQPTLEFALGDASGATVQFRVQIATAPDFASPIIDYTSALAPVGAFSFSVGQASGSGTYAVGSIGQALTASQYYWRVKAINSYGNASAYVTAHSGAVAFINDQPISTSVTAPTQGAFYRSVGTVSGTASSPSSTVTSVFVSIEDTDTSRYLDGSDFNNASEQWLAVSTADGYAHFTYEPPVVWTNAHLYRIRIRSVDAFGQVTLSSPVTFTIDLAAPVSTVSIPIDQVHINTLAQASGSITETGSGIGSFEVQVYDQTANTYLVSSHLFSSVATWIVPTVQTTATWSLDTSDVAWVNGHLYRITTRATDAAGNAQTETPSSIFTYDTDPPVLSNLLPTANAWIASLGALTGQVSDDSSTVAAVVVSLRDATGQYFDGSGFTSATLQWLAATTSDGYAHWAYTIGSMLTDATHTYQARATDNVGNTRFSSIMSFFFDSTPPTSSITGPSDQAILRIDQSLSVTGVASDTGQMQTVHVTLYDETHGVYYNGSSWTGSVTEFTANSSDGFAHWNKTFSANILAYDTTYVLASIAIDSAGNRQVAETSVHFTVNTASRVSALGPVDLVDGSFTSDQNPTFSFTQSDTESDQVKFQIQVATAADFSAPIIDYVSAFGSTGNASFTVGQAAASGTYSVGTADQSLGAGSYYWRVRSIDSAGNTSAYSSANAGGVAFRVNQPVTVSLVDPVDASYVQAVSHITGTAADIDGSIDSAQISVRDTTSGGIYFDGVEFSNASEQWLDATTSDGYAHFSMDIASNTLLDGHTYGIRVRATDSSGQTIVGGSIVNFTIDTAKPITAMTAPSLAYHRSLPMIGGTIAETGSGIGTFDIRVEDRTAGTYLLSDGTFSTTETWVPPSARDAGVWQLNTASVAWISGHEYRVTTSVFDNAGNAQSPNGTATFMFDDTPPVIFDMFPAANAWLAGPISLAGSSTDTSSAVSSVAIAIRNSTGKYYDGNSFLSNVILWLSANTADNFLHWTYGFVHLYDDVYAYQSRAVDAAVNITVSATQSFTIRTDAPVSAIDYPLDTTVWKRNQPLPVTGIVADPTGVVRVSITVHDDRYDQFFDGVRWGDAETDIPATSTDGFAHWNATIPMNVFFSDARYTIASVAFDAAGNRQNTLSSISFSMNQPSAETDLRVTNLANGSVATAQPTFTFIQSDQESDPVAFEIQIASAPDFSAALIDYTSSPEIPGYRFFTVGQTAPNGGVYGVGSEGQRLESGTYYWRVRGIDAAGNISEWSVPLTRDVTTSAASSGGSSSSSSSRSRSGSGSASVSSLTAPIVSVSAPIVNDPNGVRSQRVFGDPKTGDAFTVTSVDRQSADTKTGESDSNQTQDVSMPTIVASVTKSVALAGTSIADAVRNTFRSAASVAGTFSETILKTKNNPALQSMQSVIRNVKSSRMWTRAVRESDRLDQSPSVSIGLILAPFVTLVGALFELDPKSLLAFLIPNLFSDAVMVQGRKKRYGLVFDAETGKPLPTARISVTDARGKTEKCLSNGYGMYAVLVPAGEYRLTIEKEGYVFSGATVRYAIRPEHRLYIGEPLVFTENGMINADIPLERIERNIGRATEKVAFMRRHEQHVQRVLSGVFLFGFGTVLFMDIFHPSVKYTVLSIAYVYVSWLRLRGTNQSLWGEIISRSHRQPIPFSAVKLFRFPDRVLETRTVADEYGRYYLFGDAGEHRLAVLTVRGNAERDIRISDACGMVTERVIV
jgi:hypothetical protein